MPLSEVQSDAIIAAVREVAAVEILPRFRNLSDGDVDAKSSFDDLVTVADRAAEQALTARIRAILPGDTVIGEEAVSADASLLDRLGEGRVTVIDPIDGTWNFANGIANYGVIIAVVEGGQTVWGLLYDPGFDDWIVAHLGKGAVYRRAGGGARRLATVQEVAPLDTLRGNLGAYQYRAETKRKLAALGHLLRRNMSFGASVHEYRGQALGATDFCLNGMLNVWDHAAGVLVLQEAGGFSRLLDGQPYSPLMREGRLLNARSEAMWHLMAETVADAVGPQ